MSEQLQERVPDVEANVERMEAALRRIENLQRVTDATLAYLDLDDLLRELLERTVDILDADTAAILLVEEDGKTLAARAAKGLEEEVERGFRLPVGTGFAGRVAATRAPVVLPDLDRAPFEPVNPLFRKKGVRALLGVPLIVERQLLGVLHVGSLVERDFDAADVELLQLVADRVALAIERERLIARHRVAAVFQRSVLPARLPEVPGLELTARYLPAATEVAVGGDWYDVIPFGAGVSLAIGDVVGHGVEAVALMTALRSTVRALTVEASEPAELATRLARFLQFEDPDSMATFIYCRVEPDGGEATIVNAGHPPPLLIDADGNVEFVTGELGPPLGVSRPPSYAQFHFTLPAGAVLLLHTDGLIERRGDRLRDRQAELARLVAAIGPDPDLICDRAIEAMLPRTGPEDDVAVLAVRNLGLARGPLELTVRARPQELGSLRRLLRAWLRRVDVPEREISEIVLATSEACANAIEHAYGPAEATFGVRGERVGETVEITVQDSGRWRQPRGSHRGRGIVLMNSFMDSVELRPKESGTTVVMSKRIRWADA